MMAMIATTHRFWMLTEAIESECASDKVQCGPHEGAHRKGSGLSQDAKWCVTRNQSEITVCCEEFKIVTNCQLG